MRSFGRRVRSLLVRRRPARIAALTTALVVLICVAPAAAATLTVNTTTDEVTPNDGLCSLREAISAVNAPPGNGDCGLLTSDNTIALGGQPYALTRQPAGTDDNSTGDLTVTTSNPVTISGAGAANTSIDATGLHDRVLDIAAGANVTLTELRVRGGQASDGSNGQPVASCPSQDGGAGESGSETTSARRRTGRNRGPGRGRGGPSPTAGRRGRGPGRATPH